MRTPGTGPAVSLSESELVFPSIATSAVVPGHVAERLVTMTNTGSAPITIYHMNESTTSRNGEGTLLEPRFLVDPADVVTFPATLAPGQSRTVRIYFIADAPVSPGRYRYRTSFYTNSPSQPVISVRASRQLL